MLKNALSNGYSSKVRGWLEIEGVRHELAQVGPDFCILREPISASSTSGELIVDVDGDRQSVFIKLANFQGGSTKRISFVRT